MLMKIAAGAALAAALAFSAAAPTLLSAHSDAETMGTANVGNWPDPMYAGGDSPSTAQTVGNWPDPM